jgi:DNA-binding transcriptional MerR regulator
MERKSGIRKFSEKEIEALRVIECLKKAGMEIKDIRQFMDWCGRAVHLPAQPPFSAKRGQTSKNVTIFS